MSLNGELEANALALLQETSSEIDVPRRSRIFCNRTLALESIEMIGFDMDYTIALYHQDKLEELSIRLTLDKLVDKHGYPAAIRDLRYDPVRAIRGLMVDRLHGNVFKMDRHSGVGRVYHGHTALSDADRQRLYHVEKTDFADDRFEWIDTLFGLPEAVMFMSLVEYFDGQGGARPDYTKLFNDIRMAIDEAHRDDTLKSVIKADLPGYIVSDPSLAEALHKIRSSGKRLFLLTNSLFDYTDAVMSYLLDGKRKAYPSWRNYFDIVIVGGAKPAFFNERRPFLLVDQATGAPMAGEVRALSKDKVYQGGNVADFEEMTRIRGENVLYIGDHIYGDILRLRKQHMWRTALVLQELEQEISVIDRLEGSIRDLELLDRRRRNLEGEVEFQAMRLRRIGRMLEDNEGALSATTVQKLEEAKRQTRRTIESLRDRLTLMTEEVSSIDQRIDRAFNPYWGSCLREGNEASRFGEQVYDYADLYTSRVSNFGHYSPLRTFLASRRTLAHEQ